MSVPTQLGLGAAISSVGTEIVHGYVLPEVGSGNFYNGASMILSPILQGALFTSYAMFSDGLAANRIGAIELFGLGTVCEVGASYLNDGVVRPWLGY